MIHPVFHIADGDIRMGAFTGCHDFNGKLWIADPSADQRRIKYKGFHKSVSGTPHYLILFRFTDPSCRIGAAVDGKTGVIAVDKETGYAREKLEDHFAAFMDQAYLSIGKVLLGKAVCILWHPVCLDGRKAPGGALKAYHPL